jgi:VanZ family protein
MLGILALGVISLAPPFLPLYRPIGFGFYLDNALHFLFFAGLGAVTALAFDGQGLLKAAAGLFTLGLVLELVQLYIPDHRADVVDFAANFAGMAFGIGLALLAKRLFGGERG